MARRTQAGGRPVAVRVDDIVRVGRQVGMARLSLAAVAAELGVSTPALYRHIDGRWELERLVGESLLADLELQDDPADGPQRHLFSFAMQLRDFVLARPGLATYMQVLFPRGASGRALLTTEMNMLTARGYAPQAAITLASAVASLTIGLIVAEERPAAAADPAGYERELVAVTSAIFEDPVLGPAHVGLPVVTPEEYTKALMTAAISGLVAAAPPGREIGAVVDGLLAEHRTKKEQ
ncbi:TetR/AcrR family transcriptional regulator [Rhodococcus sp. NPDC058521]|uniref:TetR/AcrR family transcriptional regulator n=1 Tax=Rhodococcus sp. NPDC058521 TaxID=3346536 RepID=UPI003656FDD8